MIPLRPAKFSGPTPDDVERGVQSCFQISTASDSSGWIRTQPEATDFRWQFGTEPKRSAWSPLNLLRKPDFVVRDQEMREVLRIRRLSRIPSRFEVIQAGELVGTIRLRSLLRNRYTLDFREGSTWTFRMPLFSIQFYGMSTTGSRVWVIVGPGKRQWNLLMDPESDDIRLLACLAFIHREWWCYS